MFNLVDRYTGTRLGTNLADIPPSRTVIVESDRRLHPETSYGFVHALWWVRLEDGRSVISVPPGSREGVDRVLKGTEGDKGLSSEKVRAMLKPVIESKIKKVGLPRIDRILTELVFACDGKLLRPHPLEICQRLSNSTIPLADGVHVPLQCIADGVAFGVIREGVVVSAAYAHRSSIIKEWVVDIGVETTIAYRRRGYAQAAVSALVRDYTRRGGEARYACNPENAASIATAKSVGFVPYARSLILSAATPSRSKSFGN